VIKTNQMLIVVSDFEFSLWSSAYLCDLCVEMLLAQKIAEICRERREILEMRNVKKMI
jgi:hypothetical protein